jgi:hypothetical protein
VSGRHRRSPLFHRLYRGHSPRSTAPYPGVGGRLAPQPGATSAVSQPPANPHEPERLSLLPYSSSGRPPVPVRGGVRSPGDPRHPVTGVASGDAGDSTAALPSGRLSAPDTRVADPCRNRSVRVTPLTGHGSSRSIPSLLRVEVPVPFGVSVHVHTATTGRLPVISTPERRSGRRCPVFPPDHPRGRPDRTGTESQLTPRQPLFVKRPSET